MNVDNLRRRLNAGLSVNARNSSGDTLLIRAIKQNRSNVVRFLLERGARPNDRASDAASTPPLLYAARNGNLEIVRTLVYYNAYVNYYDLRGYSALMKAAAHGHSDVVRFLIQQGANVSARTDSGKTALDLAKRRHHAGVVRILENAIENEQGNLPQPFNWNAKGNLIAMPNKLKNNKNIFTVNRFKYGVPYVQVKTPTGNFYYSKAGFKRWYNSKGTDPLTKAGLNNKNLKIVQFKMPKNIENKAQSMRRQRAAKTIARAWRGRI